jgi:hypothetical protein
MLSERSKRRKIQQDVEDMVNEINSLNSSGLSNNLSAPSSSESEHSFLSVENVSRTSTDPVNGLCDSDDSNVYCFSSSSEELDKCKVSEISLPTQLRQWAIIN